jgi:hypothetical protein
MSSQALLRSPPNLTARPLIGTASDPVLVIQAFYEYCGTVVLFSNVFPLHHCEQTPHCNLRKCMVLFRCGWIARDGHDHAFWRNSRDISGKRTVAFSGPANSSLSGACSVWKVHARTGVKRTLLGCFLLCLFSAGLLAFYKRHLLWIVAPIPYRGRGCRRSTAFRGPVVGIDFLGASMSPRTRRSCDSTVAEGVFHIVSQRQRPGARHKMYGSSCSATLRQNYIFSCLGYLHHFWYPSWVQRQTRLLLWPSIEGDGGCLKR